jgi:uncharacterized repeat protein (TIGR04138 family)
MPTEPTKTLAELSRELGCYSLDAFQFLHQGLDYTVKRTHGPLAPGLSDLVEWLHDHGHEPAELEGLAATGGLPKEIEALVEQLGGAGEVGGRLNRHVGGRQLCWGLRDLAMRQWGLMATCVLRHWGIRSTKDFGRMVFALVNSGMLQKQPHDRIEDFDAAYDFEEALDRSYEIRMKPRAGQKQDGAINE